MRSVVFCSWADFVRKVWVLALFCLAGVPVSPAALTPRVISPAVTDPDITGGNPLFRHWVFLDDSRPRVGKLFVFLPGTGGPPNAYKLILETAAQAGCHSIGLTYVNEQEVNADLCAGQPATCQEEVRLEIITGADTSPRVEVNRANSIENRLVKLLEHLHRMSPAEGWDAFLNGRQPRWELVAVAGHSQGGGHAAMIGKIHLVHRVGLFSSTEPAAWTTENHFTPSDRYFGFAHTREESVLGIARSWVNLGLPGALTRVDDAAPPANGSHRLLTALPPRGSTNDPNYHGCVVTDPYTLLQPDGVTPTFRETWLYMIGPGAAPPSPPLVSATVQGANVRLEWLSSANEVFAVEYRGAFSEANRWMPLADNFPAAVGPSTTFIHTNALVAASGYYRVLRTQ